MKKLVLFLMPLLTVLGFLLIPNVTVSAKSVDDAITSMSVSDLTGQPLTDPVKPLDRFRVNATFTVPAGTVAGDTTTITLPASLLIDPSVTTFDVKDSSGNIVAKAVANTTAKTITSTYTSYVETHSGTNGSFFFAAQVDKAVEKNARDIVKPQIKWTVKKVRSLEGMLP